MRARVVLTALLLAAVAVPQWAHADPKPNIVFILTDDQSLDITKMPFVNGRRDWIRFPRAFLNDPLCCPSRATLLTGLYSHHTRVEDNSTGYRVNGRSTLPIWLRGAGYRTALVGKYLNDYPFGRGDTYIPPGWTDFRVMLASKAYFNYQMNRNGTLVSHGSAERDYSTDVLTREAIDVIRTARSPFFLQLAYNAPHGPFTPAPRHEGRFKTLPVRHRPNFNESDASDKPTWVGRLEPREADQMDEQVRERHEIMLAVDEGVQAVFSELSRTGKLANTVVVFMTDNGFAMGEHRWEGKNCPYEECVRTPLLVRYPGRRGRTDSRMVSNVDIAPTFARIARARLPRTDGRSMLALIAGGRVAWPTSVLLHATPAKADEAGKGQIEPPTWWGVRTPRFKYIRWQAAGAEELYDLARDPAELTNVARNPRYASTRRGLAARLVTLRAARP